MNVIDDEKLQQAADEAIDRAATRAGGILASLDGWTLTIQIPVFYIWKLRIAISDITIRLNKPSGVTK
jgi:hypothetical protein